MIDKKEIYRKYKKFTVAATEGWILDAIRLMQEEAYNQALRDAAECARVRTNDGYTSIIVGKESILKLKR